MIGANPKVVVDVYRDVNRRMSLLHFKSWVENFAQSMYEEGVRAQCKADERELFMVEDEEFFRFLLSVPGVGKKTANNIINAMKKELQGEEVLIDYESGE